jgi:hypothetical protein
VDIIARKETARLAGESEVAGARQGRP